MESSRDAGIDVNWLFYSRMSPVRTVLYWILTAGKGVRCSMVLFDINHHYWSLEMS